MGQQFSRGDLCKRCSRGLRFPTIDYPSLKPEDVLAQSPLVKTAVNPSGPYSLEHGLHRFECDYFHEDGLPELPILAATASRGCLFCRLLHQAISSFSAAGNRSCDAIRISLDYFWGILPAMSQSGAGVNEWILRATLHVHDPTIVDRSKQGGLDSRFSVSCWTSGNTLFWPLSRKPGGRYGLQLRMPPPMSEQSLGEQNIAFLQSNIHRCLEGCSHKVLVPGAFVPSRLIDVQGDSFRVVQKEDLELRATHGIRYATLSYCWGSRAEGLSQMRLTKETMPQLRSGFVLEAMSPVQKDAVIVSRSLNIPYLWIDALCILQDDASDWERESSMMHRIYGDSLLTICNLKTQSCQQSFLSRQQQLTIPFDTINSWRAAECYRVGPGSVVTAPVRVSEKDTWSRLEFENTQWITRAWTFQEAAMSTRMIMFANSGVYFNCSAGLVWEYNRVVKEPLKFSVSSILDCASKTEVYQKWNLDIVPQFSGRKATYLSDSLPALSGLAQIFATVLEDEYVAGLWKHDLLNSLFWKLKGSLAGSLADLLSSFDGPYIGPSWSWIGRGVDAGSEVGEVRSFGPGLCALYPKHSTVLLRRQCSTLEASSIPLGADKFGKIGSATLLITGRMYPLGLGYCNTSDSGQYEDMWDDVGNFCVERPDGGKLAFSYYLDFFPNSNRKTAARNWTQDLILVLVGSIQYRDGEAGEESIQEPYGLIVHQAAQEDMYWRVGTFGPSTLESRSEMVSDLSVDFFQTCEETTLKI
ncbi:heterokaryon incompatibility protein-domain-containing protein, partial [Xylaria arbuscula]